ncbi:unnamed protein product [Somion occarium]|uniref:Midasin n=1 Tax=Somion occarium TaxID=3059160 RepID=A0ABP1DXI5_9APHY
MELPALPDPLKINWKRQTGALTSQLPSGSHALRLQNVSSKAELLEVLSGLLATPGLTMIVATAFRPLLIDLCARWLTDATNGPSQEDRLEALCLLLEIHPEIFSILSAFLRQPEYEDGPLGFINTIEDLSSISASLLHRILLAYYRILQASRELPRYLIWPLKPLSKLIWTPHPDPGVRFLAIRCYALHSGMMEGERVKMEKEVIGDVAEVDCPIEYSVKFDEEEGLEGKREAVDGWIMPAIEVERVVNARNKHLEPVDYYSAEESDSVEPIHPAELSQNTVNIHGVLIFSPSKYPRVDSRLIDTPTAVDSLRMLAIHISMNVPTLLTSSPSAGKSLLLSHLASTLYPNVHNQIVTIHLADTSLDPRSLLGSHISSTTRPGTFEWKAGVLVRAMREGKWVVFEDIDRGSSEVLGMIKPLVESLGADKWIGGRAVMEVPGQGRVEAHENFALFATRSVTPLRNGQFPQAHFFGAHKWHDVMVKSPTHADLRMIIDARFPRLAGVANEGLIRLWVAVRNVGSAASTREIGLRELDKLCTRVENLLPASFQLMDVDLEDEEGLLLTTAFPNTTLREDIYFEARDVFFGAGATTAAARAHLDAIATLVAEHLALTPERRDWVLQSKIPEYQVEKDVDGQVTAVRLGRTRLVASPPHNKLSLPANRPFAMHKPAVLLMSRIATSVSLNEPILLTGETGTGKTSVVTHLASLLRKPLISLNLSHQTESADIIGGFKPVDARVPASELQTRFLDLFGGTFSRKRNAKFEEGVRKAVQEGKWRRAVALWLESAKMAKDRIQARAAEEQLQSPTREGEAPRKRRKTEHNSLNVSEATWDAFERDVRTFEVQHVQGNGKFAFGFVEGPLVKALRLGHWILLDEVNLASSETLECISGLLHGPTASITLTEQGSLEPVKRHPDFRLFACMNPATDVGKKDLTPNIRSRFSEIDVPPPDADQETLLSIVSHYIGPYAVGDKGAIMDVAEFYTAVRRLAERREIADGSNHRPHFSMRTLARALTFTFDIANAYSLRRALWEGCLMAFTMVLDKPSAAIVTSLAQKHVLSNVKNVRSLLARDPASPKHPENFIKFGPFYLERGPLPEDPMGDYIMTPSVETKLVDLARIIVTRRFPVLIEGPTSSGKTSSIEYLARRTGHRFIRINNHEHTDIQEYIGTYVSDPTTGKLVFKDGLLVRALRQGDWIVLDELNLAPTDVLEALNRLLDDNRELVIPETQEVVKPHPHFMLFATQNPPGLYAGRKILSRAFRNRFLEVHFEDVPQVELETILCQRCRIAPSYGQKIVAVFEELQKRRQTSRIFESKHGFATLRDLFRWAGRDAIDYQELADNGFMLLAERTRRTEDRIVVKEIIESIMKVRIDEARLYDLHNPQRNAIDYLDCPIPSSSDIVWTSAMQRLFILVARALRFNEPVLLVGETGCGKTSVCQLYAQVLSRQLYTVNCHQNTETADLIGGLRPVRNRGIVEAEVLREFNVLLPHVGEVDRINNVKTLLPTLDSLLKRKDLDETHRSELQDIRAKALRLSTLFQWYDGPLIEAMRKGDVFLMDEISLADDSVLERLNSVLEPSRTVVLAERGDDETDLPVVEADEHFKLVATMNPGGDYGKKELSPALRNRFTEIWVPSVSDRRDLEQIVNSLWKHDCLKAFTEPLLDFTDWLSAKVSDRSIISLRDILAWVHFSNAVYSTTSHSTLSLSDIFHHAAFMTFLDGLDSLPQLASYSPSAVQNLRAEAIARLHELVPPAHSSPGQNPTFDTTDLVQLGTFALPRGPKDSQPDLFSFRAPTTRDNVSRVIRACQLPKPILLEGSPGVGKTSLVTALANICGYDLCRINLSDQTDIIDLFGSDLPVEGEAPGQFAWKDAEFLRAMQEGHWVLLDEMNLAPQAILEGLNAVLDHRGTVYIPELGRSFTRHPSFRIFAAQNPVHQGGGRKGLPKSFLNRFTKVYVQELRNEDILIVCQHLFPELSADLLRAMIIFTTRLHEETMVKQSFGREGSPWEFNLRDVIRWGSLLRNARSVKPGQFLSTVFSQRFRNETDRGQACVLFDAIFADFDAAPRDIPRPTISPSHIQVGLFNMERHGQTSGRRTGRLLHSQLSADESVGLCVANRWLTILTGPHSVGKSTLVRTMAALAGRRVREISINSATDANDLLGSFEEVDVHSRIMHILDSITVVLDELATSLDGSKLQLALDFRSLVHSTSAVQSSGYLDRILEAASTLRLSLQDMASELPIYDTLVSKLAVLSTTSVIGRFEWVDGPLVTALKEGSWLLLDDANLCSPSVLDRLNALCEINGYLTLNEKGATDGQVQTIRPHPGFRLFMCVSPQYGDLSRAMRNRGVEIALLPHRSREDHRMLVDHLRLPSAYVDLVGEGLALHARYAFIRRGSSIFGTIPDTRIPTMALLGEDSPLVSALELHPPLYTQVQHPLALSYFVVQSALQAYIPQLNRFLRGANLHVLSSVLRDFSASHLFSLSQSMRKQWSVTYQIAHDVLAAQPNDLKLSRLSLKSMVSIPVDDLSTLNLLLLRLFVASKALKDAVVAAATAASSSESRPNWHSNKPNMLSQHVKSDANALVQIVAGTSQYHADSVSADSLDEASKVKLLLKLVAFSQYLLRALTADPMDFSALHVAAGWFIDCFRGEPQEFYEIEVRARAFVETMSLSSGHGILELWDAMHSVNRSDAHPKCATLERAAHKGSPALRSSIHELMAMHTIAIDRDEEQHSMAILTEQLRSEPGIASVDDVPRKPDDVLVLIVELAILSRLLPVNTVSIPETVLSTMRKRLKLSYEDSSSSLHRLVSYVCLTWADEAGISKLPSVANLHREWFETLWSTPGVNSIEGPALLCIPLEFIRTMTLCDWKDQTLGSLASYDVSLQQHRSLALLRLGQEKRTDELASMLVQSVLLVAVPFRSPSVSESLELIANAVNRGSSWQTVLPEVLAILSHTKSGPISNAFNLILKPPLQQLLEPTQTSRSVLNQLGRSWIALGQLVLELFVPSAPIDPAALRNCAHQFHSEEEATASAQLDLHIQLERRVSGTDSNDTIRFLQLLLEDICKRLGSEHSTLVDSRKDLSRLHSYWAEVDQLLQHVLSPTKLQALLSSFEVPDASAFSRERIVQESLVAFSQRLTILYGDFEDMNKPLQLAFHFLKFGLRIVCHTSMNPTDSAKDALALSVAAFPTISSAEQISVGGLEGAMPLTFTSLIARLSAIFYQAALGDVTDAHIQEIKSVYERAFGLWMLDRARTEEREREAQSLYRQKKSEYDASNEAELEEEEFRDLFPEFEDVLDDSQVPKSSKRSPQLIELEDAKVLYDVHQMLFLPGHNSHQSSSGLSPLFSHSRIRLSQELVVPYIATLSEGLDSHSLPFRLNLLNRRIQSLLTPSQDSDKRYDFYLDANIPETRKGHLVIQAFLERLESLISDWPEQMVLHHLKSRCEAITDLSLSSPVAKILSALEQLLLHSEDWEQFANRDNSLKNQRQILITQIVDWRRLELSSWQGILETQAKAFTSGLSEWWFRLYEVLVSGTLNAAEESRDTGESTTAYLDSLLPLLNDFMTTSPIGHYSARLGLLQSMEVFVSRLAALHSDPHKSALSRVHVILCSSRRHFAQHQSKISTRLSEQRAALEKEIRGFIKLASWRDVNVQALKQSAQKTHRLLYKNIRKFRDILRQPVADILQSFAEDNARKLSQKHGCTAVAMIQPTNRVADPYFPERHAHPDCPPHLVDLPKTFRNFRNHIEARMVPFVTSRSAAPVNELAEDVLSTVETLSKSSIPTNLEPAKRGKFFKNLLSRKRKAWSDFMKELKRAGLSANVKPDILAHQQSMRWLREQPLLVATPNFAEVTEDIEDYFYRVLSALPDIRAALSNHHDDLSTRDLQRSLMFVESSFTFALRSRSRLADTFTTLRRLHGLRSRIHAIASAGGVFLSGPGVLPLVLHAKDTAGKAADAMRELRDHLDHLRAEIDISSPTKNELENLATSLQGHAQALQEVWSKVTQSRHPVLLRDEVVAIAAATQSFSEILRKLNDWTVSTPQLRQYFEPIHSWLASKIQPEPSAGPKMTQTNQDFLIEPLLLSIQSLVRIASNTPDHSQDAEAPDGFIRDGVALAISLTSKLNLDSVADEVDAAIETLSTLPQSDVQPCVGRFAPFLDEFMILVEAQAQMHAGWTRSLFKLNLVLASIVRTVSREGFCQPKETEEGETGDEGGEAVEGTGLGEGTGKENVSKEIQDESQVEGLQGEDETNEDEDVERAEEGNAVEMSEDIGGKMQDVPDAASEDGEGDEEEGSEQDLDEQLGDLDASDENTIDEKLWGDEPGPKDEDDTSKEPSKDDGKQSGDSQIAAKQDSQNQPSDAQEGQDKQEAPAEEAEAEEVGEEEVPEEAGAEGAPIDEHLKSTEILDLPDDLDMDMDKDGQDIKIGNEDEDMSGAEDLGEDAEPPESADHQDDEMDVDSGQEETGKYEDTNDLNDDRPEQESSEDNQPDAAVAQADVHSGDGTGDSNITTADTTADAVESKESDGAPQARGGQAAGPSEKETDSQEQNKDATGSSEQELQTENALIEQSADATATGTQRSSAGISSQAEVPRLSSNPLRSLGDALREITQRFDEILESEGSCDHKDKQMDATTAGQLEYLQPDETESEMHALGPAGRDEIAKLNELTIADEEMQDDSNIAMAEDQPSLEPEYVDYPSKRLQEQAREGPNAPREDVDGALIPSDVRSQLASSGVDAVGPPVPSSETGEDAQDLVERQLRQWQAQGQPSTEAEHIWRLYESLTHDLSYALCEQLRLILEPTMATRLKGDYRTGKRLNMKKIIPYIASEYTKDKIWLRRTRPSQREYQVLVALDDSRSMSESHSVHLAYQTLALVSKALSRLEVGDIAIAKFGESVEVLHGFDQGPFTDQAGTTIMDAFHFNQKATQVLSLVERSLSLLEEARERRSTSSASAGDLWQMEIIISDGICQDHDRLRTILRKAEEQRVMVVFIILDSLHTGHSGNPMGEVSNQGQNSILSMNQVAYKEVEGRMDLTVSRYLDTFPFEYYVVVRDVEALPDVLAGTLKQFFERISED